MNRFNRVVQGLQIRLVSVNYLIWIILGLIIYILIKSKFYFSYSIPSPDEFGYVLSSRWFEDAIREGNSFGSIFSAHGIYQLFIGFLYLVIGNDDLFLPNLFAQILTICTAILIYKILFKLYDQRILSICGSVIFLSLPDIVVNGHRYWLDIPAMFLMTLLIYVLLRKTKWWVISILILAILMTKEYVFFLASFAVLIIWILKLTRDNYQKKLFELLLIFIPTLIYIYIVLFLEWFPTNSILDSIFNDFFLDQNSIAASLGDGNVISNRFHFFKMDVFERLWFKFYEYAFDESIIIITLIGVILWIVEECKSIIKSRRLVVNNEYILFVFFLVGFSFYMISYIQHLRVFFPFLVTMVFFLLYPIYYISKSKNQILKGLILFFILTSLLTKTFGEGLRNLEHYLYSIFAFLSTVAIIINRKNTRLPIIFTTILILISINFFKFHNLGIQMWAGINNLNKPFYDEFTPQFRNSLHDLIFSGEHVTYDFIFHHYEMLYLAKSRKTQNDYHYSMVTLRPNNYQYDLYPKNVLPVRVFDLEKMTNQTLDTCRTVYHNSDYLITRNELNKKGLTLIDQSENGIVKIYKVAPELKDPLNKDE